MSLEINQNPAGKDLAFQFNVITNVYQGQDQFKAELILTNNSAYTLKGNWSIYFNFLRMILPESVSTGFRTKHINGDYFSLEPTTDFSPLLPKSQVTIRFLASFWAIKTIDAPVGFYIVYRNHKGTESQPELLPPISIGAFDRPEQLRRHADDMMPVPNAESRYKSAQNLSLLLKEDLPPIMPSPLFLQQETEVLNITSASKIAYQDHLKNEAQYLADAMAKYLGKPIEIVEGNQGDIRLSVARVSINDKPENWNSEAYTIQVDQHGVELTGTGSAAVFYSVQSLIQLLSNQKENTVVLEIPYISVRDKPQFAYRGLHLDVARNFHGVPTIKKLMDMISFYKLNKFHFHLTDDEGWRIEIPDLPELTAIGGRRGHTYSETDCLLPSYGSGWDPDDLESPGNGYYSRQEFIELLKYAHSRHIEVIPAIDFPGHARAAVRAMEVRHDHYQALGEIDKANQYLLTDWEDESEYESVQLWRRNVVNIGLSSTYRFIEKIVDELLAMYAEADVKLSAVHVGGDEVPPGAWTKSPACIQLMQQHQELQNVHDLAEYFIKRVNNILGLRGVITAGWEEITLTHEGSKAEPNPSLVKHDIMPYTWNTLWGSGGEEIPYRLANLGYKVVLSNAPNLYLDFAYSKDPEEAGYYWGGYTDILDTFKFLPFDFFRSAEKDSLGNTINPSTQYENAERLNSKGRNNIFGIQGQLWGETIRATEQLEYLLFPRLCALAERAWSKEPEWATIDNPELFENAYRKNWNEFANRLGQIELPRLDYLFSGVGYRVPMAGAIIKKGLLMANTPLPGLTIRYTTDGTEPTNASTIFEKPIPLKDQPVKLKIFTGDGRRSSRTTTVNGLGIRD